MENNNTTTNKIIKMLITKGISVKEIVELKWIDINFGEMFIALKDRVVSISWEDRNYLYECKGFNKRDDELVVAV